MLSISNAVFAQNKVGWLEDVVLSDGNFKLVAKMDTGADHSAVNASNIQVFEQNNQSWVRFDLHNRWGQSIRLEKPVVRLARVKMKNGGVQERMVVEMGLCLNSIVKNAHVSLVDRSHFKYQMLVGRSFLQSDFVVDAGAKFIQEKTCSKL